MGLEFIDDEAQGAGSEDQEIFDARSSDEDFVTDGDEDSDVDAREGSRLPDVFAREEEERARQVHDVGARFLHLERMGGLSGYESNSYDDSDDTESDIGSQALAQEKGENEYM